MSANASRFAADLGQMPAFLSEMLLSLEAALNSVLHTLPAAPFPAMASLIEDPLLLKAYRNPPATRPLQLNPKVAAGLPAGPRPPPDARAVRERWGRVLWAPLWAALQWEHWFCCGGVSIGLVRHGLRLCLLVRSNLGFPYVPREYRASSRGGVARDR